ncbi:MAG TPA: hypothetical protein VJC10_03095 [Patescibacteria group bacterium]|nr:hypothetical protein [Patescibacteria group bacterium]
MKPKGSKGFPLYIAIILILLVIFAASLTGLELPFWKSLTPTLQAPSLSGGDALPTPIPPTIGP